MFFFKCIFAYNFYLCIIHILSNFIQSRIMYIMLLYTKKSEMLLNSNVLTFQINYNRNFH